MTSLVHSCHAWLRRSLPVSNSRQAWEERLGAAVSLAGIAIVWWYADGLALWQQGCLWSLLVLAVAILLRHGWLKLLGPLFRYELARAARRSRYVLLRVYVYFILLIYIFSVMIWWVVSDHTLSWPASKAVPGVQSFFFFLQSAHLLLIALLTPGYTAGAIADEKDRRTLEALLVTDLRNREIVLSKLVVRLANLAVMLVTGVPILCLFQFLGGVEPDLVVAGLIATGATMASLASLAILNSVYARRSRDAILYTYLEVAAYALVSALGQIVHWTGLATWIFDWGSLSVSAGDLADFFGMGNPVIVLAKLLGWVTFPGRPIRVWAAADALVRDYAVFHGVLAVLFATWATVRLRAAFLKQVSSPARAASTGFRLWRWRVGDWPMIWKETLVDTGLRFNWFGRTVLAVLVIASFVPALVIRINNAWFATPAQVEGISHWTWVTGAMVASLLLVGVAVRAATSISSERDRLTWDSLLTTPLEASAILFGKWLGCVFSVRWGWLWLGVIWGLGSILGGLHALALPLLLLAWMIYAGLLAVIGLWFSLVCQSSLRAIIWTLFTILAVSAGFLVLPVYSSPLFQHLGPDAIWIKWLYRLNMGMAPPVVLGRMLPFGWQWQLPGGGRKQWWEMEFALLGLGCWAVAAVILWFVMSGQFRRLTGRHKWRPLANHLPGQSPDA